MKADFLGFPRSDDPEFSEYQKKRYIAPIRRKSPIKKMITTLPPISELKAETGSQSPYSRRYKRPQRRYRQRSRSRSPYRQRSRSRSPYRQRSRSRSPSPKTGRTPVYNPNSPIYYMDTTLNWNGHPTLKLTEMYGCLYDIIVDEYLSHGSYGLVYKVKYKGKECAMKVFLLDEEPVEPASRKNTLKNIKGEYMLMEKLSKARIAPEVYLFKTCSVKMPEKYGDKTIQIGIIISDLMRITLGNYIFELIEELNKMLSSSDMNSLDDIARFLNKFDKDVNSIQVMDEKIIHDSLIAMKKFGINNYDINRNNVMLDKNNVLYITDWGLTRPYNKLKIQHPHEKVNKKYLFTLMFIDNFLKKYRSLLMKKNPCILIQVEKKYGELYSKPYDTQ